MPQTLNLLPELSPLSISLLVLNLVIGFALSMILRWHFYKFGSTLSNREEFAQVFPFILLTTILIITVVKSSLALSLGLVGALSIVRFRTPIKEPEELAYLFMAIAMGLGLGANQTIATVLASIIILGSMAALKFKQAKNLNKNLYLSVDWQTGNHPDQFFQKMNAIILRHVVNCDLRRYDLRDGSIEATYFLDIEDPTKLADLTDELRKVFPSLGLTFLDQSSMPSV
ncbi:MAG: DUF4956 domain-containing protein [Nitrospinales bacterium]